MKKGVYRTKQENYKRGSVTVEASLGIFLFLMFFVCVLYFYQIINLEVRIQSAMDRTVQMQSAYYTVRNTETKNLSDMSLTECQLNYGFAAVNTIKELTSSYLNASWIVGGSSGLDFSESKFLSGDDCIHVKVKYKIRIPCLGNLSFTVKQHAVRRVWAGDDSSSMTESQTVAYMTPNGSVYHLYADCSYIQINPEAVNGNRIANLRNESGACYYACEYCNPSLSGMVYITKYGTRYHSSASCSAIERDVQTVSMEEVNGRPLCSKCAKRKKESGT